MMCIVVDVYEVFMVYVKFEVVFDVFECFEFVMDFGFCEVQFDVYGINCYCIFVVVNVGKFECYLFLVYVGIFQVEIKVIVFGVKIFVCIVGCCGFYFIGNLVNVCIFQGQILFFDNKIVFVGVFFGVFNKCLGKSCFIFVDIEVIWIYGCDDVCKW